MEIQQRSGAQSAGLVQRRETSVSRHHGAQFPLKRLEYHGSMWLPRVSVGPQLIPYDAERRQSLEQLYLRSLSETAIYTSKQGNFGPGIKIKIANMTFMTNMTLRAYF